MTQYHQERRRRALERLETRIARQKDGPNSTQLAELQSLHKSLQLPAV